MVSNRQEYFDQMKESRELVEIAIEMRENAWFRLSQKLSPNQRKKFERKLVQADGKLYRATILETECHKYHKAYMDKMGF